jgi:hypothetical protein
MSYIDVAKPQKKRVYNLHFIEGLNELDSCSANSFTQPVEMGLAIINPNY